MKSQWFGSQQRYQFGKLLEEADYGKQYWDLFSTFLTMASCALRQNVRRMALADADPKLEADYLRAAGSVKYPDKMAQALGVLTCSLQDKAEDFLGSFSMEVGVNDKHWKGQCFTPIGVCQAMTQIMLFDAEPKQGDRLTLQEPACGGGAMVIACSDVLKARGFYPWNYYWQCVDVDWRMFAACYIQTCLLGIPATVIHGNTLSGEVFETARTFAAIMHPFRDSASRPLDPEVAIGNTKQELERPEPDVTIELGAFKQLSLF